MKAKGTILGLFVALMAMFTAYTAGAQHQVKLTTAKKVDAILDININANGAFTVEGATLSAENQYKLTDAQGNIVIKGDVRSLVCSKLELTALDVTQAPSLTSLYCEENELKALDVKQNEKLKILHCFKNQIRKLKVDENEALEELFCYDNPLYTLDLSENKKLRWVSCSASKIGRLKVAQDGALETILCSQNELKGAGMQRLLRSLPNRKSMALKGKLMVINNSETPDGNIFSSNEASIAEERGWLPREWNKEQDKWIDYAGTEPTVGKGIMTLTTSKKKGETLTMTLGASDCVNIELFEIEGAEEVSAQEGIITFRLTDEQGRITIKGDLSYFVCVNDDITALDVSKNPQLGQLVCSVNALKTIDVRALPYLETLDCYGNKLSTLDVSHNALLSSLMCGKNELSSLDVRANTELEYLYCDGNRLSEVDLSANPELESFDCSYNQITALDFSHNPDVRSVACAQNNINERAMDALIASLFNRSDEEKKGDLLVVDKRDSKDKNVCLKRQVATARQKGWMPKELKRVGDNFQWVDFEGTDVAIEDVLAQESATIVAIYSVDGRRLNEMQEGVNIVRLSNGKVRKVIYRK